MEIVEDGAYIQCELPHFLGYAADVFGFDDADGEPAQSGDVFWPMADSYTASILVVVPVNDLMAAVFNGPVAAIDGEDAFWIGLVRSSACDAICDFRGGFAGLFVCGFPLDHERLSHMGEMEIVVELGCDPYFSDFDPAVIGRVALNEIGIFRVFKMEGDIFKESGLVVLDGEMVVSVPVLNQIFGEFALCQEGICGDIFAFDIDGLKEWDAGGSRLFWVWQALV